jgi:hypothetical protein
VKLEVEEVDGVKIEVSVDEETKKEADKCVDLSMMG